MRTSAKLWLVVLLASSACDPRDACDPGYYADHGACYLRTLDGGAPSDGGLPGDDATIGAGATFGTPCAESSQCGGDAPLCAAPMLPYCTAINCLNGSAKCPAGWECLDVRGLSPDPAADSICFRD